MFGVACKINDGNIETQVFEYKPFVEHKDTFVKQKRPQSLWNSPVLHFLRISKIKVNYFCIFISPYQYRNLTITFLSYCQHRKTFVYPILGRFSCTACSCELSVYFVLKFPLEDPYLVQSCGPNPPQILSLACPTSCT